MNLPERWRASARVTDGDGECEPARLKHERDLELDETGPREEAGDVLASRIAAHGARAVALEHERVLRALRMTRARRLAIALGSSGQGTRAR